MSSEKTGIVILGAGYAGLMAALRLSGKTREQETEIVLVNGSKSFVQRPRLHHVATGQDVPEEPLAEMLRGSRVQFLQGWVTAVDPHERSATVETGAGVEKIGYDILIYALGSVVDRGSVPGVRDYAYVLDAAGTNSATAVQNELQALARSGGEVVVVGSGPTGVEGATEIKGQYPGLQVSLVTAGRFGEFSGPRVAAHIREAFRQQDIAILEESRVLALEEGRLLLTNGREKAFDLCLWAGGFRAPALAREAGFTVNERGQILVDPFGRALSHSDVYAAGDAGHPVEEPGVPMRMSLLTALTRGAHAADNISALLAGREEKPLSFAYYGQGIALGPEDAVGFMAFPDDRPRGPILRGKTAVFVRNFFVWLIFYFLRLERRWPGFYFWIGKGRYEAKKGSTKAAVPEAPAEMAAERGVEGSRAM